MTAHATTVGTPQSPPDPPAPAPKRESDAEYWKGVREDAAPIWATVRLLEAHPWLFAAMFSAVVGIKILAVSAGDFGTAGLVLGSSGFTGLASIVALSIFPTAAAGAFVAIGAMVGAVAGARGIRGESRPDGTKVDPHWAFPAVLTVLSGFLLLFVLPATHFLVVAGLMSFLSLVLFLVNLVKRCAHSKKTGGATENSPSSSGSPGFTYGGGGRREFAWFLVIVGTSTVLGAAASSTMWLPAEKITFTSPAAVTVTTDGTPPGTRTETITEEGMLLVDDGVIGVETVTAYVLSREGDYTTLLLDPSRETRTIPSDTITNRQRCNLNVGSAIIPIFGEQPAYEESCYS